MNLSEKQFESDFIYDTSRVVPEVILGSGESESDSCAVYQEQTPSKEKKQDSDKGINFCGCSGESSWPVWQLIVGTAAGTLLLRKLFS